jgi:hypothetical protein
MDWKLISDFFKEKRKSNTINSTDLLIKFGIPFESKNYGAHLVVDCNIDFWPSTGLFINRKTKKKGRGISNLLKLLKKEGE